MFYSRCRQMTMLYRQQLLRLERMKIFLISRLHKRSQLNEIRLINTVGDATSAELRYDVKTRAKEGISNDLITLKTFSKL